jgi:DNA invertase Pin-like site-specific DNA recombinase
MIAATEGRLAERTGGRILSAAGEREGDDPDSKLMRTMIETFAEYERALIKARTRSALAIKAAQGEKVGGVQLYGAADVLYAARADVEREIVSRASTFRATAMPGREIAADLNARGLRTRSGGLIQPTQVARILGRAA